MRSGGRPRIITLKSPYAGQMVSKLQTLSRIPDGTMRHCQHGSGRSTWKNFNNLGMLCHYCLHLNISLIGDGTGLKWLLNAKYFCESDEYERHFMPYYTRILFIITNIIWPSDTLQVRMFSITARLYDKYQKVCLLSFSCVNHSQYLICYYGFEARGNEAQQPVTCGSTARRSFPCKVGQFHIPTFNSSQYLNNKLWWFCF